MSFGGRKELFWYREEMLKLVSCDLARGEPLTPFGRDSAKPFAARLMREGTLSLRNQALRPDMLDVLRDEQVQVTVNVVPRSSQPDPSQVEMMDFVDVRVQVTNRLGERPQSAGAIYLLTRCRTPVQAVCPAGTVSSTSWASALPARRSGQGQPAAGTDTAAKHIAFDGLLARTLGLLQPGETASHDVGAVFTLKGSLPSALLSRTSQKEKGQEGQILRRRHCAGRIAAVGSMYYIDTKMDGVVFVGDRRDVEINVRSAALPRHARMARFVPLQTRRQRAPLLALLSGYLALKTCVRPGPG